MNSKIAFLKRFEIAKEDLKQSICRQVDDFFAAFVEEFIEPNGNGHASTSALPSSDRKRPLEKNKQQFQPAEATTKADKHMLPNPNNGCDNGKHKSSSCPFDDDSHSLQILSNMLQVDFNQPSLQSKSKRQRKCPSKYESELCSNDSSAFRGIFLAAKSVIDAEFLGDADEENGDEEEEESDGENGGSRDSEVPRNTFACPVADCSKVFSSGSKLSQHQKNMHFKRYHCTRPSCNRSFHNNFMLRVHENTHAGIRPFKCRWAEGGVPCSYDAPQRSDVLKVSLSHLLLLQTQMTEILGTRNWLLI